MKRDMDLIKWILGALDSFEPEAAFILSPSDVPAPLRPSESELNEHYRLLVERGLVRGEPFFSG